MRAGLIIAVGFILLFLILNLYYSFRRANLRNRKGKGRKYLPPDEDKRAQWRDREIARRLAMEQDDALERVKLRNETLSYYEAVRNMYNKKEAMERLGIKTGEDSPDGAADSEIDKSPYKDVRDDIYIYEDAGTKDAGTKDGSTKDAGTNDANTGDSNAGEEDRRE